MTTGPVAPLEALWPARAAGPAFLTTFTFDAPFFEFHVLVRLQQLGAHPVVVLVDRHAGYTGALGILAQLEGAGRDYHLVPVALDRFEGVFHPKVHLFSAAGVALVGSGNLTPTGCGGNIEAMDRLDAVRDGTAVGQIRAFFRALLVEPGVGLDTQTRDELLALVPVAGDPEPGGDARFLSTLDGPLWDQLGRIGPAEPVQAARLIAPFHDPDHRTSHRLLRAWQASSGQVVADEATPWRPLQGAVEAKLTVDDERPLHAKVLSAVGPSSSLLVVGSANLTDAAWSGRNVEAIVVRTADRPDAFAAFEAAMPSEAGAWGKPDGDKKPIVPGAPPVDVRWARVEGSLLTIGTAEAEDIAVDLQCGADRVRLSPVRVSDGWRAPLERPPTRTAVAWIRAPGRRETGVVVDQPALLATSGRSGRLRRMLQRLDAGLGASTDRRDLFACLSDVLAALRREGFGSPRTGGGGGTGSSASSGSFHDGDAELIAGLVDLSGVQGTRPPAREVALVRLTRMVDALIQGRADEAAERAEDRNERARATDAGPERPKGKKKPVDADEEFLASVKALVNDQLTSVRQQAVEHPEAAFVTYATVLRLLRRFLLDRQEWQPAIAPTVATWCLGWLNAAWGVPEWPSLVGGWVRQDDAPEPRDALAALAEAWPLLPMRDQARDLGRRVMLGAVAVDPAATDALPLGLHDELLAHRTRGELARVAVAPLWDLDAAEHHRRRTGDDSWLGEARRRAKGVVVPGLGTDALHAWERAGERMGSRVHPAPAVLVGRVACPACNRYLPGDDGRRLARCEMVVQCEGCRVLVAHGGYADGG